MSRRLESIFAAIQTFSIQLGALEQSANPGTPESAKICLTVVGLRGESSPVREPAVSDLLCKASFTFSSIVSLRRETTLRSMNASATISLTSLLPGSKPWGPVGSARIAGVAQVLWELSTRDGGDYRTTYIRILTFVVVVVDDVFIITTKPPPSSSSSSSLSSTFVVTGRHTTAAATVTTHVD